MDVSYRFGVERSKRLGRGTVRCHRDLWGLKPGDCVTALETYHDGQLVETASLTRDHLLVGHNLYDRDIPWTAIRAATEITDRVTVVIAIVLPSRDGYIWLSDQLAPQAYRASYMAPILEALPAFEKWSK